MLIRLVSLYQSNSTITDHIYQEQLKLKNDVKKISINNDENKNHENKVIRM